MFKMIRLASVASLMMLVGACSNGGVSSKSAAIQSCFQGATSSQLECFGTPGAPKTTPTPVTPGGPPAPFVCADVDQDHDGQLEVDDRDDNDNGVADDTEAVSKADENGGSPEVDDDDGDGIPNEIDCGHVLKGKDHECHEDGDVSDSASSDSHGGSSSGGSSTSSNP